MAPESEKNLPLEIGHVLFIDLVGYSKLLIEEQKERLSELTDIVLATAQVVRAANEELVRLPTGDGMALVFRNSSEEPARCALEIVQALKADPQIRVRMGIHSGPVSEVTDVNGRTNIAGAGINMAQRVMDCGDAGHILLSGRVADDLAQYRQWSPLLHDLGECEVKHGVRLRVVNLYTEELGNPAVPAKFKKRRKSKPGAAVSSRRVTPAKSRWPLILAAVLLAGALISGFLLFWYRPWANSAAVITQAISPPPTEAAPETPTIPEKSIAVLPFENRSEEKANAYFADGIQDEILTRLSKIADLKVISHTSTQHYKSAPENLPEIARQLGVAHILEGSVQKSGDAVRVNVQLIKAANDSHLWADTFDRKLTDIFSVESEVAKAIADQLRAKLTGHEEQVIAAKPTDNPEAYDAYLRGLAYTLKTVPTPANALAAQKYLREAVHLDPKFALSWALLSYADSLGYITTALQPTVALREEARQAAETALALQPNLGEAVLATGYYHYSCLKDYDTAVHYFEQARQLLPNSSQVPESLAYVARRRGQWDRSDFFFNEAERLDPRNVSLLTQHALTYVALRRFPEALRKLDQVLDITPDDVDTLMRKAGIAQAEGDLPHASMLLASLHPAAADPPALETQVYQAILERQARSELESYLKEQPQNHRLIRDLALTNLGLGDKAAAYELIERAMGVIPIEKDALDGPDQIEILARVAARTGEPDRAMAALQKLLAIPYEGPLASRVPLTPALLRLDPMFDPLRNDPRFQKLAASDAAKPATPASQ
jgi:TolB-like protein/class 3 adenylate cyclase/Tfp pilus assembly protein PilF